MKKTTFSDLFGVSGGLKGLKVLMTISLFTFFATQFNSLSAQPCTLGCFDDQVSLGNGCEGEITAEMVSNTSGVCTPLTVIVYDENFVEIPTSPTVNGDYLGRTLNVGVWDELGNNCWSEILILDKMKPTIDCGDTLYMSCLEMAAYPGPTAIDNCEAYGSAPTVVQVDEDINPLPCDSLYIKEIVKKYIAIDASGNVSLDTCTQVIYLERFDMSLVEMPGDFSVLLGNALSCNGIDSLDAEGHPHPFVTGAPFIPGPPDIPLWPLGEFYCNINVVYTDFEIPAAGCVEKIMRTWTIYEWWCSQEIDTSYVQLIEIADTSGPVITCPPDVSISTDGVGTCVATFVLPAASATDNCNNPVTWSVVYPGGVTNTNGGIAVQLTAGNNEIIYTAYDNCYLSNSCTMNVYVEDNTPPVAICDQNTVVALTSNGLADVYWHTFDDGSYDDCGIDKIEVRRMSNGCGIIGWNVFKESVTFCCSDIANSPVQVIMKVTDLAGNTNECMVNVTVQDKLPPSITCPPNITIDCEYPYDLDNLWEFGKVVTNGQPDSIFVNGVFKGMDGEAYDNCQVTIDYDDYAIIGDCGTGTITRIFVAEGPGGVDAVCSQTITVENNDPFNGYDPNDLSWPPHYTAYDVCETNGLDPDDLPAPYGWPVINEDACDLVGISWSDMVFNIIDPNEEACMKILRMWKVIDWCEFQNNQYTVYEYTQIIKVHNTVKPWFDPLCADVTVESFDPNCGGTYVELIQSADDDCTPINLIEWTYRIDFDNDGVFDGVPGHTNDASAVYPVGTHRIVWSIEDLCGNIETCTQLVTVFNDKPPTPYVYNGLAIDIMAVPGGGMVEIWASDFDAGSFHACGYDITLSFSSDPTDQSVTFTCDNLGVQLVQIWVTDEFGNQDYVVTFIDVQDNFNVCPGPDPGAQGLIAGQVSTEMTENVEEVAVVLEGSEFNAELTDVQGIYSFPAMGFGGSYNVRPEKNDDYLNGVNVLDLVLIQKHILGLEHLNTPNKLIAADADDNSKVTAQDIIEIRKLILGLTTEYTNNDSWRFIDGDFSFQTSNPLAEVYPEYISVNEFSQSLPNINFTGIKIGDVNDDVVANNLNVTEDRSNDELALEMEDASFSQGSVVSVDVRSENFNNILAYQFTLNTAAALDLQSVVPGKLEMTMDNFGLFNDGIITTAWNATAAMNVESDDVLFTLVFKANTSGQLSDFFEIGSTVTTANAYSDVETLGVSLNFSGNATVTSAPDFTLNQNTPNPFSQMTEISFVLPEASNAVFSIFDVNGKLVYSNQGSFDKGFNKISVDADQLGESGVYYYQIDSKGFTATKNMILVK